MTDSESTEVIRRIKQLNNQNLKLSRLLSTALALVTEDNAGVSKLREETASLSQTLNVLEKEKDELQQQLDVIEPPGSLKREVRNLEHEHSELRAKLDEALSVVSTGHTEIEQLRSEDEQLRRTLEEMEAERAYLMTQLKQIEEQKNALSHESFVLKEKLAHIESIQETLTSSENVSMNSREIELSDPSP
ncbi:unnamed protein product [Acanthoscelides obtectus]|uniref:Uncharacterized protein n=1 Tax=Acanthoscelides obtectus TaxID=200917 RepID=A0A9P0PMT7_ACAOB|nr:unnamed protein product [Acanthoscelides obtectus]CAK1662823.1 hypothetical protein AOBTE_LOCUS23336 [Acanthoscelides obtectus]